MTRIDREKYVIGIMIQLYCRGCEGNTELCDDCAQLMAYAIDRLDRCPQQGHKPTCRRCTIHCYSPAMRERIRKVMRYSGPRMLWYHPLVAVRHMVDGYITAECGEP